MIWTPPEIPEYMELSCILHGCTLERHHSDCAMMREARAFVQINETRSCTDPEHT